MVLVWWNSLGLWGCSLQEPPCSHKPTSLSALCCRKILWRNLGGSLCTVMSSDHPSIPWSSALCWAQAFSSSAWSSSWSVSGPCRLGMGGHRNITWSWGIATFCALSKRVSLSPGSRPSILGSSPSLAVVILLSIFQFCSHRAILSTWSGKHTSALWG